MGRRRKTTVDDLRNVDEAAAFLEVNPATMRRWSRMYKKGVRGIVPRPTFFRSYIFYDIHDLERFKATYSKTARGSRRVGIGLRDRMITARYTQQEQEWIERYRRGTTKTQSDVIREALHLLIDSVDIS